MSPGSEPTVRAISSAATLGLLLCLGLAAGASAQVYKCAGADGKVEYVQVPPAQDACKEREPLPGAPMSSPEGPPNPPASAQAGGGNPTRDPCAAARERLAYLEASGGKIHTIDGQGRRVYLSEQEYAKRLDDARAQVNGLCS